MLTLPFQYFTQVHAILNEIIQGGLVLETNINDIAQSAQAAAKARKASANAGSLTSAAGAALPGTVGSHGAAGWTPPAGLGGMPWGDAAANVGGWARGLGARLGGGLNAGSTGRLQY